MIVHHPPALFIYYKKLKIKRDDNEDLATIIRYLVDNQNPRNTKYTNIKFTEVILTGRNNYKNLKRLHRLSTKTKPCLTINKKKKKKKELIRKIKVSEIGQINMNDYLEIPGTRTFRNARNVTQEMADKIEYAKYLINKNISMT
jgi:hypothetical protein